MADALLRVLAPLGVAGGAYLTFLDRKGMKAKSCEELDTCLGEGLNAYVLPYFLGMALGFAAAVVLWFVLWQCGKLVMKLSGRKKAAGR